MALVSLVPLVPFAALADEGFEEPAFAMPVIGKGCGEVAPVHVASNASSASAWSVFRSRGDSVLSVVREIASAGAPGRFVEVGPEAQTAEAGCVIEVLLERPLEEPRTIGVDFRGAEMKEPGTATRLTIELGAQRHVFDHAPGQVLEDSAPHLRRFQLELPTGTNSFRIAVSGHAERTADGGAALVGFDSLDLCFMDSEEPEFCGGPGYPNPRAVGS